MMILLLYLKEPQYINMLMDDLETILDETHS